MTGRRMSAILASRGIRGLLIPPLPKAHGHLTIDWSGFAVMAMSFTIARPLFHRVLPDLQYNMQLILRAFRHRGYKRIGLLLPRFCHGRFENRFLSAFLPYQQGAAARNQVPVLLCEGDFKAPTAAWLRKHQPEAVITVSAYRHIREIDIGDPVYSKKLGVAVIAHGPDDLGFTGVDERPSRIGAAAVDHLSMQLNLNGRGIPEFAETVLIKGVWVNDRFH
jgi:LacI family transcriptional regulator